MSSINQKIKKLLALADDRRNTPEGELAAQIAMKLMKEHAVELGEADEPITFVEFSDNTKPWRRALIEVVATFCHCRSFLFGDAVRLYGHEHDVQTAQFLVEFYSAQLRREGRTYADRLPAWADDWSKVNATDRFLRNAVYVLNTRLAKVRGDDAAAPGTMLVLQRGAAVDGYVAKHFDVQPRALDLLGPSLAGRDAGNRLNLGLNKEIE